MDISKHASLFDPTPWHARVAIVGIGALGSAVALSLAKLGIQGLNLYDGDKVEPHNLPNQILYGPDDVGEAKAIAASKRLTELTGYAHFGRPAINLDASRAGRDRLRYQAVFVCVDSMDARNRLFNNHVYINGVTRVFCEGRMSSSTGSAYLFDPTDSQQVAAYREELYPDSDVVQDRGACGNILSIGATAVTLASCMTWMFIDNARGRLLHNEVVFSTSPWSVQRTSKFDKSA